YQLISRLLLAPEQNQQLSDSLKAAETTQTPSESSSEAVAAAENTQEVQQTSSFSQFNMKIEISMVRIEQQTLTISNEFGTFTQQITVVEAFSLSLEISIGQEVEESDPLIIDMNGDGLTSSGVEQGAIFDINADGKLDQVSVPTSDNVFLALDINNNGRIDNGSELFGDQTGYQNGFSYLASFDGNNDGLINANDAIFDSLLTLRLSDNQQFITELSSTPIKSINLGYSDSNSKTDAGDKIVQISDYTKSDGQTGVVADLLLQYKSGINK
ncbi:MAG: hypothetical protein DRQ47_03510, partial [Gammaproteobacteria bacterium]